MEPGPPPEPEDVPDVAPPPEDRGPSPYRGVDPGGRVPPYSLEAEVSVLGAAMLSKSAASEVTELLKPDDFYRSAHATVFEAVQELVAKGDAVDTVTVLEWVAARGRLDEIGGPSAVAELTAAVPTAANAAHYARIVHDKALLRRLIEAGTTVTRLGYEATEDARAAVDRAEAEIFKVAEHGTKTDYSVLKDLLNESFERIEKLATDSSEVTGLATGFNDLDRLTAGLQPENLIILAARPAMGKCVTGDTRVLLTDGRSLPIEEVVELGRAGKPINVLSLDGDGALQESNVTEFHDNGVRDVVRMLTRHGRSLTATPDHPVLTPSGWRHVGDLQPGDLVASPRRLPVEGRDSASPAEVRLLGYLLGDGCLTGSVPTVTTASSVIEQEIRELAPAFGCEVVVAADRGTVRTLRLRSALQRVTAAQVAEAAGVSDATVGSVHRDDGVVAMGDVTRRRVAEAIIATGYDGTRPANHLTAWLDELGLLGHDAHDKHVPEVVHRLPDDQVAEFLSRLYACDGSAWVAEDHGYFGISYTSVSERLARDVQHLLLRLGVLARLRVRRVAYTTPDGTRTSRPAFELEIRDARNVLRFLDQVGIFSKDEACGRVRTAAVARTSHSNLDLLPLEVWDEILRAKGGRSWADVSESTGRPRNHNWHVGARRPSRRLLAELAESLDDARLRQLACDDVLWDEVVSVETSGPERVFDLTVPEHHCFIANDLVVHNSSLALNLAQYVTVKLKKPTILFSLEMSKIEIVNRMLSSEAGIDSNKIKTGRLEDADWRRLGDALGRLADAPLYIDDTASISMLEISAKCRRLKQRVGLDLVIVDYLQLMQSHRRIESRQQEVSEISRGLKMLAKDLGVPVIALSQLSRQPESRVDKRPQLADLRESGSIEQDADIVGFIYRDEVYDEDTPDKGIAELIISKHRNGATRTIRLAFLNHLTKFANLASAPRTSGNDGPPMPPPPGGSPL